jgi:hypothetical protein
VNNSNDGTWSLGGSPLRLSRPFLSDGKLIVDGLEPPGSARRRPQAPFGYLYTRFEPGETRRNESFVGQYDSTSQTWIEPVTAGVQTKTRTATYRATRCNNQCLVYDDAIYSGTDYPTDDACQ